MRALIFEPFCFPSCDQRGMWADALRLNVAGYAVAEGEWVPGQTPGDLLHAADRAHYTSLQLGDVAGADHRAGGRQRGRAQVGRRR
jgi:hypothetical protein